MSQQPPPTARGGARGRAFEAELAHGERGLDVGHKLGVKLVATNVERGFIDFGRVG